MTTTLEIEQGTAEHVGDFTDGSPEWHEARAAGIGGSDVASILGISPWKSAYTLWHEKAGLLSADQSENPLFEWGHRLEPVVADKFAEQHPEFSVNTGGSWRHKDRPWQLANPDRLLIGEGESLLEVKTAMYGSDWADGIPPQYEAQVRWYLDVFGFDRAYVAVLIGLGDYREYVIEHDQFIADANRAQVEAFLKSVDAGAPPEIDGTESTYRSLRRLNPSIERGQEATVPDEIGQSYVEAKLALERATKADLKAKGHLLAHMGTAQYATYGDARIASRVAVKDGVPYLKEVK